MIEFGSTYSKNDKYWIVFPDDQSLRKSIFPQDVMPHPAKANLYMLLDIIQWVSEPGELLMDITAGTGSLMIGAILDRKVLCMDIEEGYYDLMVRSKEGMENKDNIIVLHGDCRTLLPLPVNHIIFSPPYAKQRIGKTPKKSQESTRQLAGTYEDSIDEYQQHPRNLGNLNRFLFNQEMEKIYKLCYQSIIPPGTLTVIIKDYIENQKRVSLSSWVMKTCIRCGFENIGWFKREALGTGFLKLWRSRGMATVSDEDIIIFRKVE